MLRQLPLVDKARRDRCLGRVEGKLREQRLRAGTHTKKGNKKVQESCWEEQGLRRPTGWVQMAWRRGWEKGVRPGEWSADEGQS